jgi:hypothetical protein
VRAGTWLVGLAVLAVVGCSPRETLDNPPETQARREGHCYLAQLAATHPLYPSLAALDDAIRRLRLPETIPGTLPVPVAPGKVGATPMDYVWPDDQLAGRAELVRNSLAWPEPQAGTELPGDLRAKLQWRQDQFQRTAASELLAEQARLSQEFSAAAQSLYEGNRERLLNPTPGLTSEQVRAELEKELDTLKARHSEHIAGVQEALQERVAAQSSEAAAAARREADERQHPPGGGSQAEISSLVLKALGDLKPPQWPAEVPTAAGEDVEAGTGPDPDGLMAARKAARERAAQALIEARNRVTEKIFAATRLAAQRAAKRDGLTLYFVPGDAPVGQDVTDQLAAQLRQQWGGTGGL